MCIYTKVSIFDKNPTPHLILFDSTRKHMDFFHVSTGIGRMIIFSHRAYQQLTNSMLQHKQACNFTLAQALCISKCNNNSKTVTIDYSHLKQ